MKTLFIVRSNPVAGREAEFNDWYNNVHLHEVLKIDGFMSAQRFALDDVQVQDQAFEYLAIYEIDTDNVAQTLQNLGQASWLHQSDAIDNDNIQVSVFTALAEALPGQA